MDNPLELFTIRELLDELKNRYDRIVIVGEKKNKIELEDHLVDYRGTYAELLGLMHLSILDLNKQWINSTAKQEND